MTKALPSETARVRRQCVERAACLCECGCGRTISRLTGELDHFFGRGKAPTTVDTCWMLSPVCHHWKTDNFPSKAYWLAKYACHCKRHGYAAALAAVRKKQDWDTTKKTFTQKLKRGANQ